MVAQFKTEYWLNSSGQVAQSGADYSQKLIMSDMIAKNNRR